MAHRGRAALPRRSDVVTSRPAVFLDRDGVIIQNRPDYVKTWDDVDFVPGAFSALSRLATSRYAIVMVTNQSAVGRGIISGDQAHAINRRLIAEIEAHSGRLDAAYMCPHAPDDRCECRKPAPGMLRRAALELDIDLTGSWMVGDAATDLAAAKAAGAQGLLVLTGRGRQEQERLAARGASGHRALADLGAAVTHILAPSGGSR